MRLICVQLIAGLLLTSLIVGCDRDGGQQEPGASVSSHNTPLDSSPKNNDPRIKAASPSEVRHRATIPPKPTEPIIVRAEYYRTRGNCIQSSDGSSWSMPAIDSFKIIKVIRGRLHATTVYAPPWSPTIAAYPENLADGDIVTLRLTLSDKTWEQAVGKEREGINSLIVDRNELEESGPRSRKKAAPDRGFDPGRLE
jgi:hypothetical protein